jgi:hypothetical protein
MQSSRPFARSPLRLALLALLLPMLAACAPSWNNRYKVTVVIYKGDQVYQASGVQETTCHGQSPIWPDSTGGCELNGEAIPVDLGDGRYFIATMSRRDRCCRAESYTYVLRNGGDNGKNYKEGGYLKNTKSWVTKPEAYPLFITFADMNNPRTVAEVDPANLAATFGDGWRFGALNVEQVAYQPITKGRIDPLLPWLKDVVLGPLWGNTERDQGTIEEKIRVVNLKWTRE